MIGGTYFAGAPFAGALRAGVGAASLAAQVAITVTAGGVLSTAAHLDGTATIQFTAGGVLSVPIETGVGIVIGGVPVTGRVRVQGVTIHDILNDAPNTCTLTIEGEAPTVGQNFAVTIGGRRVFVGSVQTVDQAYESKPILRVWQVTAIDDTAIANWRRPFGTWVETSATTIAQSLVATYALGFSSAGVAAGLPPVSIVFDGADTLIACLARLATAVGGYTKIEDRIVYLFLEDLAEPPDPIDAAHRFLANPPIQMNIDASQLRTRVYGKGYGEHVLADIAAGETLLPIPDGANFPPLGGTAIVSLTADGAQSDRIGFTGVLRPVGGTLVGPGAAPANAPTLGLAAGGVVTNGVHQVGVVHVTATGKSLIGPLGSITAGAVAPPGAALTAGTATPGTGPDQGSHDYVVTNLVLGGETTPGPASNATTTGGGATAPPGAHLASTDTGDGGLGRGLTYFYKSTWYRASDGAETAPGPVASLYTFETNWDNGWRTGGVQQLTPPSGFVQRVYRTSSGTLAPTDAGLPYARIVNLRVTNGYWIQADPALGAAPPTGSGVVPLTAIPPGPPGTTGRNIYRRFNGTGTFRLVTTITNNTATTYTDTTPNAALGAAAPSSSTATGNTITMAAIPTGGSSTTAREIYMTQAGGSALFLALTIPDNTTRDATLNLADASLVGQPSPPVTDTSGLQQPQGQVNPGATSLIVASPAPFAATGGWVITGGGQVVRYTGINGQLLTGVPAAGAGAIVTTILYGQQATPAPTLTGVTGLTRPMRKGSAVHIWIQRDHLPAQAEHAARTGGDGVVEFLIVDQRRGVESLTARCDADLALFSRPIVTVAYATRDLKTRSGKPIVINLPDQGIVQTLIIQDVTITEIDIAKGLAPRFTVKASSVRFSLEDTLRRLMAVGPVTVNT